MAVGLAMRIRNERIDHEWEMNARAIAHQEDVEAAETEIARLRAQIVRCETALSQSRRETEAERRRSADLGQQLAASRAETKRETDRLTRIAVHQHAKMEGYAAALSMCARLNPDLVAMKPVGSADGPGKPAAVQAYQAAFDAVVARFAYSDLAGKYEIRIKTPAPALPKPSRSPGTPKVVSPRTFILQARLPAQGAA